ncbi:permease-like cell division protein FtsX [Patescibacteria group bacterium AH-259-L07]|nr:permease-like cell division protein FtsX [Patescibacteria group bacterium AH-259-L07]
MRVLKLAGQNFFRNFLLSITSIIIILLMLLSISLMYSLNTIGQTVLNSFKDKMDLGIYLKTNIDEGIATQLRFELENMTEVKQINYIPSQQSLELFRERHKNNPLILKSLEELGENPLGATITIKFHDPAAYQKALDIIGKNEYKEIVQDQDFYDYQGLINTFTTFNKKTSLVGLWLNGFFVIIAILIIFNTIKLGALSRQKEVKIMRLVGATAWFIRTPYLLEAGLYALSAWILNLIIMLLASFFAAPYISQFLELDFNLFTHFKTIGITFWLYLLLYALIIAMIGSSLAIKKYLKV